MEFVHEVPIAVDASPQAVLGDFSDVERLPKIFSHVRATAVGDADDLARLVIVLDGHHLEFAAQRTCTSDVEVCWQSLGDDFSYVLYVTASAGRGAQCTAQVCVSYDPPGLLDDLCEAFGHKRIFRRNLEEDLNRYASAFTAPAAVDGAQALPAAA